MADARVLPAQASLDSVVGGDEKELDGEEVEEDVLDRGGESVVVSAVVHEPKPGVVREHVQDGEAERLCVRRGSRLLVGESGSDECAERVERRHGFSCQKVLRELNTS